MSKNNSFTIDQVANPAQKTVEKIGNDLGDINNLTITDPSVGDVIYYNGTSWVNANTDTEFFGSLAGKMTFKGDYDANTNNPNLDNNPTAGSIKKGDVYTVSVAGNFYSLPVFIGDMLIAKVDDPAAGSDWNRLRQDFDVEVNYDLYPVVNSIDEANDFMIIYDATTADNRKILLANTEWTSTTEAQALIDAHTVDGNNQDIFLKRGIGAPNPVELQIGQHYVDLTTGETYVKRTDQTLVNLNSYVTALPSGGQAGWGLVKLTSADGDYGWADLSSVNTPTSAFCPGYNYTGSTGNTLIVNGVNATNIFAQGRRLEITVGAVVSFHYITSSVYGTDTTVTFDGNTITGVPNSVCVLADGTGWSPLVTEPLGTGVNINYLVTGEYNSGQYYIACDSTNNLRWSNDQGSTWNTPLTWPVTGNVLKLGYSPTREFFYAISDTNRLTLSFDGGNTWVEDTGSNGPSAGVYVTVEGGTAYYGTGGSIVRKGITSTNQTSAWTTSWTNSDIFNSFTLFASNRSGAFGRFYETGSVLGCEYVTNGGSSDADTTNPNATFLAGDSITTTLDDAQNAGGNAVMGTTQGRLWYTSNSNRISSWTDCTNNPFGTTAVRGVAYSQFLNTWVAVGDAGVIAYSTDDGVSWTSVPNGFLLRNVNAIVYNEVDRIWMAVGDDGTMATSITGLS